MNMGLIDAVRQFAYILHVNAVAFKVLIYAQLFMLSSGLQWLRQTCLQP